MNRVNSFDTICFIQENTIVKTNTTENGKYSLQFDFDNTKPFKIQYYSPGFITKTVSFDFSTANDENLKYGESNFYTPVNTLDLSMDSLRFKKNIEVEVAKFSWNSRMLVTNLDIVHAENQRVLLQLIEAGNDSLLGIEKIDLNASMFKVGNVYRPNENILCIEQG